MNDLILKAGQVAAVLNISPKRLQNTVDAGYLNLKLTGEGRGTDRKFNFEDVVRMQALEILVNSYGLSASQAARKLSIVWPKRFSRRTRVLAIKPDQSIDGLKLAPIKLPLNKIADNTELRIKRVLTSYQEKKRGRPAGWSAKFTKSLSKVSISLQGISDDQVNKEIKAYRNKLRFK